MEVMHERVAGLDVHKETVVCCVRIVTGKKVSREYQTFDTTTAGLEALLVWLTQNGCTHAAMEATGVYWKPVWNILSDGKFELILANAAHIKNVPGRKTDVNDATWIADLIAFGLIKASFVPEEKIQELRSLTRTRKQLLREQVRHVQRMQKTLEEANIKLDSVISDIMGVSGRRMIEAMIAGVRNPQKLAQLADRRIKASPKELYDALHGRLTEHHRFVLRLHLGQYDALDSSIAQIDAQVEAVIDGEEAAAGRGSFHDLINVSKPSDACEGRSVEQGFPDKSDADKPSTTGKGRVTEFASAGAASTTEPSGVIELAAFERSIAQKSGVFEPSIANEGSVSK